MAAANQNPGAMKTFSPMQEMLLQQKTGNKRKKVVITIKQQAADGQMVAMNPALLQALRND